MPDLCFMLIAGILALARGPDNDVPDGGTTAAPKTAAASQGPPGQRFTLPPVHRGPRLWTPPPRGSG